jgi:hypothetical protein
MLFPYTAWSPNAPREGQVARFEADPSVISDLRNQKEQIILASTVTIHYIDLFGDPHVKYYQFSEVVSDSASVHYPREIATQQGSDCIQLIDTAFSELTKDEAEGGGRGYTLYSGRVWQTAERLAREVSERQALGCLGPPFGKLKVTMTSSSILPMLSS